VFLGLDSYISLDPLWYLDYGQFIQMGKAPYTEFYYPYPPLFLYFIILISYTLPSVDALRVLASSLDALVVVVIWFLGRRSFGEKRGATISLAYALLPISIIESGWNAHFEPLANLFLLLAIWFIVVDRQRLAGISLGLGTATKFYPGLLFPLAFFYIKGWRERLEFSVLAGASFALTYLPFSLLGGGGLAETSPMSPSSSGILTAFQQASGTVLDMISGISPVTLLVLVVMAAGIAVVIMHLLRRELLTTNGIYKWTAVVLGVILISMGLVAAIYPFLPSARLVYWRYPADIALVRGISSVFLGIAILYLAYRWLRYRVDLQVSRNGIIALMGGTVLLLAAVSRDVFYGWYLLWSIPVFLFVRDRRLGLTVLLCLLLMYPSYTHDNFDSLGYEEQRIWSEEFNDVRSWHMSVNTTGSGITPSLIHGGVDIEDGYGRFWFDTSEVEDRNLLENVTISYTMGVYLLFDEGTDIVSRIRASWNPTFGRHADLSLSYSGYNESNDEIDGNIIHRTSIFTNLTFVLWRYSVSINQPNATSGKIHSITFTVHPQRNVMSSYYVDYLYTTSTDILNPFSFAVVPVLLAVSLFAFVILRNELELTSRTES
jgi:hypothetical protein